MSDFVEMTPRFRRSVRIDSDYKSASAIDGFYCPASFQSALKFMAAHIADTEQCAFTWTGPYGGGKSSLALALACLVGAPKPVRDRAAELFGSNVVDVLKETLPYFPSRWEVLPIVTERRSISAQVAEQLGLPGSATSQAVLNEISTRTEKRGLLLIMDELGRGLEAAADGDGDLSLLQDIAELSARSQGRFIFLGILHQAFEEYAERLARKARDTWAKIQGRFVDISISISLEETIELIAQAMGDEPLFSGDSWLAESCVKQLRPERNKIEAQAISNKLFRTEPLHPITACLIGPLSRRRFGQNQRSVFSFLSSAETFGLRDAMSKEVVDGLYQPYLLWNYLQANYEAAILSSPDARRWALAQDALERCIARGAGEVEQKVLKTIAVLELLKDRSGLVPNRETVFLALNDVSAEKLETALSQIEQQSEVIFRKHSGVYCLYAGSDFDVEARLNDAINDLGRVNLNLIRSLADLQPLLAKRHHEETGAMRWFEISIVPIAELPNLSQPKSGDDIIGRIVFALPMEGEKPGEVAEFYQQALQAHSSFPLIIGHHNAAEMILDLARELEGLSGLVDQFPELHGDTVARREINARIAETQAKLENALHELINKSIWHQADKAPCRMSKRQLNERLSSLADASFPDSPAILNEMLNCTEPASNPVSARTKLMKRMAMHSDQIDLGFSGKNYPAERGLYISLLKETGIHLNGNFLDPIEGSELYPLWNIADTLLEASNHGVITAQEIIDLWCKAPIGLKAGLGPVYIVAYVFSRKNRIAVYGEGIFQSNFNELCVEFLARNPRDIGLRRVELRGFIGDTLKALGNLLALKGPTEPLFVAREIIGQFDSLVPWTSRTQSLTPRTLKVREILKRASDPNQLLFDDLPRLTKPLPNGIFEPDATALLLRDALAEMRAAYPKILDELKELLLSELDVRGQEGDALDNLRSRADNIRQIGGDLRLEAFVGRLAQFHGTQQDMEGIAGVAINKLPRDWNDSDRERASIGVAELASQFLKTETMARVKGRKDRRHALAVVVGKENMPRSLFREFQVADADWQDVETLAETVDKALSEADQKRREVILAALIEVTSKYLNEEPNLRAGERS